MDSQKKKKKKKKKTNIENQKSNPWSHRWQRKPNPNIVYIEQKQNKLQYKGVYKIFFLKKTLIQSKPKPNPIQSKPNPQSRYSQLAHCRRCSLVPHRHCSHLVVVARRSPLIANCSTPVLDAPSLKVFLSDSLSVSQSLSLYLTKMKIVKWN